MLSHFVSRLRSFQKCMPKLLSSFRHTCRPENSLGTFEACAHRFLNLTMTTLKRMVIFPAVCVEQFLVCLLDYDSKLHTPGLVGGLPRWVLVVKNPFPKAGDSRDMGFLPGLERSPGGGHGNPLQYSCLKYLMDRGAWWATVHRVAKTQT